MQIMLKYPSYIRKIITSFLSLLSITGIHAQNQPEVPKLVVGITIDQLRGDYLQYCLKTFGEKGFKRLLNEGLVYQHVQYDFPNLDRASAQATVYTGTNPYYHGITGNEKYDFDKQREVSIVSDPDYIGNYTSQNFSPSALNSSTIGDEMKRASNGKCDVYAVGINPTDAILSGGLYPNAVFWIEDYNGKWATSTYYKDIPWYMDRYNMQEAVSEKAETLTWIPSLDQYNAFPYTKKFAPFKYTFKHAERYIYFKTSALVNTEVTRLFSKLLEYGDLGKRLNPSMLNLTYYAGNYAGTSQKEYSEEIQDTYYKLDKEIEELLNIIEKNVGLKNTLIFLTSTGYFETPEADSSNVIKPMGEFFPKRCTALLNMYLMSIYGQGNWVSGYYNKQIFLNRKLIEQKKISLDELQQKAVEFVMQFSGVQDVTTSQNILLGNWNEGNRFFRNGTSKKLCGDIILELQPGWKTVNEDPTVKTKNFNNQPVITPLIFFGHNIQPKKIDKTIKATEIAPSVTYILRIRPPNGCKDAPLEEFLN